jgi:hypothetical protein
MLRERHRINRVGWLRAAVLGANDGLLSTSSLILGVAAARGSHKSILVAGMAGLVAGAMSMAAGEYVSVHSQADTENADLERERVEISRDPAGEQKELTQICGPGPDSRAGGSGGLADDGPQCAGGACSRRAWRNRRVNRTPRASSSGFGGKLRSRCYSPVTCLRLCTGTPADRTCRCLLPGLSRCSGRGRSSGWRSRNRERFCSRHLLGCSRNGRHLGGRNAFRN